MLATGAVSSSIYKLVKIVEKMSMKQNELTVDQKRVNFAMKLMIDSLPPTLKLTLAKLLETVLTILYVQYNGFHYIFATHIRYVI